MMQIDILQGTGKGDFLNTRKSSGFKSNFVCPSIVILEDVREVGGTLIFISELAGRMIGRNDRECGATGVTQMT
jgi:hypothetical protein